MKIIKISSCNQCPYSDHKGAFATISYIPVCRNNPTANPPRELPYTTHANIKGRLSASPTNQIPDWCPLEDYNG